MIAALTLAVTFALGSAVEPAPPTPPTPPTEPTPPSPSEGPVAPVEPVPAPAPVEAEPEDIQEPSYTETAAPPEMEEPGVETESMITATGPARPHFVFINTYGLTAGVNYFPSWDSTFFFGGALRKRKSARRWALGYQLTASVGGAERYTPGITTLRHHLAAYTYSASGRLLASASLGAAFFYGFYPSVLEGEGRIAYVFGRRREERRLVGIVGAVLRIGWTFAYQELIPMPQAGAFIGFAVR